ncbi:response regulator [Neolewinella litorea]|nr:response regulator [Neolewinella litorea]
MGVAKEIVVRANGREGLQYFTSRLPDGSRPTRPDLLFLDINMPVMDGWGFLDEYQHLREEDRARVTIAMLTSSAGDPEHERYRAYSVVDGHEAKPLTQEKITALLNRHFG